MGSKTRGNYRIDLCLKVDCINQGIKEVCDKCFKFSEYEPEKVEDAPINK